MAIELNERNVDLTSLTGSGRYVLAAGKTLKIESSPQGEEILEVEVPEGESWNVGIFLSIYVTDAE